MGERLQGYIGIENEPRRLPRLVLVQYYVALWGLPVRWYSQLDMPWLVTLTAFASAPRTRLVDDDSMIPRWLIS